MDKKPLMRVVGSLAIGLLCAGTLIGGVATQQAPAHGTAINPQPLPPRHVVAINPQPLPPRHVVALNPQPLPPRWRPA